MTYAEIKKYLSMMTEPADKLEAVMEIGAASPAVPAGAVCHEIAGCASRVEICRMDNNFYVSADSAIVRGVAAILCAMVDGLDAEQIREMDMCSEFRGLNLALGAGRLNGVNSMISFFKNL